MTGESIFPHISELVCKSLEGEITAEEVAALNGYVRQDAAYAAYYVRCVHIYSSLKKTPQMQYFFCLEHIEGKLSPISLEMLGEYEKIAPAVPVLARPAPARTGRAAGVERAGEQAVRQVNKASVLTAILSLAALLFFVVFAQFSPDGGADFVATLSDSVDAQWAEPQGLASRGERLSAGASYLLRKGVVSLVFDNQAEAIIEGPAEFEIASENRIRIEYGRLYVVVPQSALGFSVVTANSTIIDLGTEFGVMAGLDGSTELHVIKGKTAMVVANKDQHASLLVGQGTAKRVYGPLASVSDIVVNERLFVRKINSQVDLLWRGDTISLADIVGGGSGFGDGMADGGINPLKGEFEVFSEVVRPSAGPRGYQRIDSLPLIDGVFVPDGSDGPVQVSSEGHLFESCPATNGEFWQGIFNGAWQGGLAAGVPKHSLRLEGVTYGAGRNEAIYMHANQGITFDLAALRKRVGGVHVRRFCAKAGISETVLDFPGLVQRNVTGEIESPKASFYVLIDGQVRFEAIDVRPGQAAVSIDIPLSGQERFLTLVTTQGSDPGGNHLDWTLFAEPILHVERP